MPIVRSSVCAEAGSRQESSLGGSARPLAVTLVSSQQPIVAGLCDATNHMHKVIHPWPCPHFARLSEQDLVQVASCAPSAVCIRAVRHSSVVARPAWQSRWTNCDARPTAKGGAGQSVTALFCCLPKPPPHNHTGTGSAQRRSVTRRPLPPHPPPPTAAETRRT